MLTYSIFMTWLVGFIMGVIALAAVFVYMDGREQKRAEQARLERLSNREGDRTPEQIDADEESALALVKEELGGTILSYE